MDVIAERDWSVSSREQVDSGGGVRVSGLPTYAGRSYKGRARGAPASHGDPSAFSKEMAPSTTHNVFHTARRPLAGGKLALDCLKIKA